MKTGIIRVFAVCLAVVLFNAGCGVKIMIGETAGDPAATEAAVEDAAQTAGAEQSAREKEFGSDAAGTPAADNESMITEHFVPVSAGQIKDGVYAIKVDSSSSMFRVTGCELTVEDGMMHAVMTMGGTGYLKLYMGTGEAADGADEADYIPFQEIASGEHTFEVPVSALDMEIDCSAFSKNKETWYDRVLVFRSDSLPEEAFAEGELITVESLKLEDGRYMAEVTLEGGSGRAGVESPAVITVTDGRAVALIIWSSSNYDYMKVNDDRYEPVYSEGNSTFEIPVSSFDRKIAVIANTIAMSQPHEVEYTLFFDASTLEKAE